MATTPSLSVVIRTYSLMRWENLADALHSIYAQTLQPAEIVVVVDHNAQLLEKVKEAFPSVRAVESHFPQGSSGAWNSGVAAATGDILVFMDDDAVAEPNWLQQLIKPYSDPHVTGVGGLISPRWQQARPAWFPEEFDWVVGCSYRGLPESIAPVRNLIGCNMSFRKSAFEVVGGFREGMGHVGANPIGCDETELCIRLRQAESDTLLLYEPLAVVHHCVPVGRATFRYFIRRCVLEGRSKALVSHFVGSRDGLATERAHALAALPKAVARGFRDAFLRFRPSGVLRAAAIMLGFAFTASSYLISSVILRKPGDQALASKLSASI